MFDSPDDWVWDFWLADEGPGVAKRHHLFFLNAPRELGDPHLRHRHARVGHAVSEDLDHWERLPDALLPSTEPAFDDLAIWTGSVVRADDGRWQMFYSALSRKDEGRVQRIGMATSDDLHTWTRGPVSALPHVADARWYAKASDSGLEHWRDPFVVRDGAGRWHMYITAKAPHTGAGVIGHAVSGDLATWEVLPPLSRSAGRFGELEVIQLVDLGGQWVLVFSCLGAEMLGGTAGAGGTWAVNVDGPGAPVDLEAAFRLTDEQLYVAKLVRGNDGTFGMLAFHLQDESGQFVGGITDLLPLRWSDTGVLEGFSKTV